jgi:hypothetical protein
MLAAALLGVLAGPPAAAQESQAIGLSARLDRPAPVYAVDDGLVLTVTARRDSSLRIWLRDPAGRLSRLYPSNATGEPLSLQAGRPLRIPSRGALRVTPPVGRYELLLTAEAAAADRSLTSADSRLAGRQAREQRTIAFTVEQAK